MLVLPPLKSVGRTQSRNSLTELSQLACQLPGYQCGKSDFKESQMIHCLFWTRNELNTLTYLYSTSTLRQDCTAQ